MTRQEICARWIDGAERFGKISECGAFHIVVADGNVEDDGIRYCFGDERLTEEERAFGEWLLGFEEEERAAMYYLADYPACAA